MPFIRNPGRRAGVWYLLLTFLGPLSLIYIPSKLFVSDNATATIANLAAHQTLFRIGILSDLASAVILLIVTLAFYDLFHHVDRKLSVLVVITGGIMPALLYFTGAAFNLAAVTIVHGSDYLAIFDKPQRDAIAMLFLRLNFQQTTAAEVLWGTWLFPLAILIWKSRYLPRFISIWLTINGITYIALSITGILYPAAQGRLFTLAQPALFGEMALILWLVIKGSKSPSANR